MLALKDADIGIAMGSGGGASPAVAQLVLLAGRFATVPIAAAEGRRVFANVERVGNLSLTMTAYAMSLAIAVAIVSLPFSLLARHLHRGFVGRILRFAVSAGVTMAVATFFAYRLALVGSPPWASPRFWWSPWSSAGALPTGGSARSGVVHGDRT